MRIKKTTKFLIATTIICSILNIGSIFAIKYLIQPSVSMAETTGCNDPQVTFNASHDTSGSLTTTMQGLAFTPYHYEVKVTPPTGTPDTKTGAVTSGEEAITNYQMTGQGDYRITVTITPGSNNTCAALPPSTQTVNWTGSGSGSTGDTNVTAPKVEVILDAVSFRFGGAVNINYHIVGHDGDYFSLLIDNAAGVPQTKIDHQTFVSDDYSNNYSWTPEEDPGATDQDRTITVNTYSSFDSTAPNDSSSQVVTVIGSTSSTPPTGVDDGDSNNSNNSNTDQNNNPYATDWGTYDAPNEEITVGSGGSTITFKMPSAIVSIPTFAGAVIGLLVYLVGAFAFIGICIGGIQYITSGGDQSKTAKAKKTLIYSVIAIVLATFSLTILWIAGHFWGGPR